MDREAWWATVYGVSKSQTRLRDFSFLSSHQRIPTKEQEWRRAPGCQRSRWTALRLIVPEIGQRGPHRQTRTAVADQQRAALLASPS